MPTTATYLDEKQKRLLLNRLSRVEGQIRAIKNMVREARCADDILVQASAARGALGQFIARLLDNHLADCVNSCMEGDQVEIRERLTRAIQTALKLSS